MTKITKRKYEKIDEAEIDLVLKCNDGHEFYERYRETFPTRKKGIESISKIWKRRNEFLKKRQVTEEPSVLESATTQELASLVSAQNRILAELTGLMNEQLTVSKSILAHIQHRNYHPHELSQKPDEVKITEHRSPGKKAGGEKSNDIMIGS